jgi:phospho-N-acetylmuramoyl-pentapeptide-transferase
VIRLIAAAAIAMFVSLIGTKLLIAFLRDRRIGQPIREEGPEGHHTKAGTPTMGGLAIVGAAGLGWIVSDIFGGTFTRRGILVMLAVSMAALVGLVDDGLKVFKERNLGLNKRTKMIGLLVVAIVFVVLVLDQTNVATTISFTRYDWPGIELGQLGWAVLAVLLILASTNAVNLTDGLDGLAAGSSIFAFASFVVICFIGFRHPGIYGEQSYLDLGVIAASLLGGCVGFLWWNAAPAQIFMGDTGALAIGAALATLSLSTNTVLLLPIIGGLFVMETVSVILQVGAFRVLGGRRVFRMAPIHHHFELGGWPETTVIVRLWIIAGLCTGIAVAIFYADFVRIPGVIE